MFITLRSAQKLPSRKKNLPSQFATKAILKSESQEQKILLLPEYLPAFLPLYKPPAFFDGRPVIKGVQIEGKHNIYNLQLEEYLKGKGIKQITHEIKYVGGSFERLLAKAAYGHAVYRYGLEGIKEKIILPVILGQDAEFNRYIGVDNLNQIHVNLVLGFIQLTQ